LPFANKSLQSTSSQEQEQLQDQTTINQFQEFQECPCSRPSLRIVICHNHFKFVLIIDKLFGQFLAVHGRKDTSVGVKKPHKTFKFGSHTRPHLHLHPVLSSPFLHLYSTCKNYPQ
jgi:hypothetical protein